MGKNSVCSKLSLNESPEFFRRRNLSGSRYVLCVCCRKISPMIEHNPLDGYFRTDVFVSRTRQSQRRRRFLIREVEERSQIVSGSQR
mmetsp:Transcript_9285/g.13373  ORF Transcript_9285/g.13373 Transcript_9285/m.13373 type:complete len:87 (-) Transcript_9285:163-423(-)